MKFYYNNELVRTSKSHIYTHAVIDMATGSCKGCRANRETAEAIISTEISMYNRGIENCKKAIKALGNGSSGYMERYGKRTYFNRFGADDTIESFKESIEWRVSRINEIKETWKVVELEARA